MRILTTSVLISTLALSACGTIRDSRINPANWFGNSRSSSTEAQPQKEVNPLIPVKQGNGLFARDDGEYKGKPIDQVTSLVIERVPGGAVIRATGLAAVQGVHAIQLTPENDDEIPVDGVLTYRLEGIKSKYQQPVGSENTRKVIAARALTDQQLSGVRTIRVEGARNVQTSRR